MVLPELCLVSTIIFILKTITLKTEHILMVLSELCSVFSEIALKNINTLYNIFFSTFSYQTINILKEMTTHFFGPQFTCNKKRNISFGQSMKENDILLNFGTKSKNNNI